MKYLTYKHKTKFFTLHEQASLLVNNSNFQCILKKLKMQILYEACVLLHNAK